MLTFHYQRPHLHQPPGPYQEPHLNGVVFPTATHMALLQDIKGLCCEPPRKMPYSAHSTFLTTDTSDVTGSAGSSAQEAGHHSPLICDCFCARRAVVPENHGLQSLKYVICSVQVSSVAQSCQTLCDPMNGSTPGLCPSLSPGVHSDSRPSSP